VKRTSKANLVRRNSGDVRRATADNFKVGKL
jgi:hypothetical protein